MPHRRPHLPTPTHRYCFACYKKDHEEDLAYKASDEERAVKTLGSAVRCPYRDGTRPCGHEINLSTLEDCCPALGGPLKHLFMARAEVALSERKEATEHVDRLEEVLRDYKVCAKNGEDTVRQVELVISLRRVLRLVTMSVCPSCGMEADISRPQLKYNCMAMSCENAYCAMKDKRNRYCFFCREIVECVARLALEPCTIAILGAILLILTRCTPTSHCGQPSAWDPLGGFRVDECHVHVANCPKHSYRVTGKWRVTDPSYFLEPTEEDWKGLKVVMMMNCMKELNRLLSAQSENDRAHLKGDAAALY